MDAFMYPKIKSFCSTLPFGGIHFKQKVCSELLLFPKARIIAEETWKDFRSDCAFALNR